MGIIVPNRRSFVAGLAALFCAPAIVRAQNIMPVRTMIVAPTGPLSIARALGGVITWHSVEEVQAMVADIFAVSEAPATADICFFHPSCIDPVVVARQRYIMQSRPANRTVG